ncbi:MAG TPA: sigma 54-interacting transcriptional regulator, partial [Polyangiaceae bacterium]
ASEPELEAVVVHPPEVSGARFPLRPELVFGRVPDSGAACIPHATISRQHAKIRAGLGGVLCLEDLGSRNGTKLNGKPPGLPLPVLPQTLIRLGDVHLVVDLRSERGFEDDEVLRGASALMADARERLERAAPTAAPVLVFGETGTGKERVASELHRRSARKGAYVALNSAELSPQLVESQLFGHERGAFTGAAAAKSGLFAAADGGTLFFDEIGELPLDLQPKLLRVLQEGELRRVGGTTTERVDVRIVAATNRDLPALVEAGAFRRDLYARLAFHEIRLPPLRERRRDLVAWLSLLWKKHSEELGVASELLFAPDAVERILLHDWRDNLRGLDRLVHQVAGLVPAGPVSLRALVQNLPELGPPSSSNRPEAAHATPIPAPSDHDRIAPAAAPRPSPSREELLRVYEANGRSVRATAKHFGRERRQIYRWLDRFGIPREEE